MANQLLRVVHVLALIAITTGSLTTGQAIDPENHSRAGAQRGGGEDLAATLLDFFWPLLAVEPASVHGQTTAVIDEDGEKISDRVIKAIRHEARLSQEFLLQTRRHLHQHPELSYQEHQTSLYIQDVLDKMKIGYTSGWGRNKHLDAWKGPGATASWLTSVPVENRVSYCAPISMPYQSRNWRMWNFAHNIIKQCTPVDMMDIRRCSLVPRGY